MTPLYGHTSPETAYVVADYPYGFRLRTTIRFWLERDARRGYRFVSQTMNPKRPGTWNKPKASTYSLLAGAMYLDEQNHVQWQSLHEYSDASAVLAFLRTFSGGDLRADIRPWVRAKIQLLARLVVANEQGDSGFTINDVPQAVRAGDLERNRAELSAWQQVLEAQKW